MGQKFKTLSSMLFQLSEREENFTMTVKHTTMETLPEVAC